MQVESIIILYDTAEAFKVQIMLKLILSFLSQSLDTGTNNHPTPLFRIMISLSPAKWAVNPGQRVTPDHFSVLESESGKGLSKKQLAVWTY